MSTYLITLSSVFYSFFSFAVFSAFAQAPDVDTLISQVENTLVLVISALFVIATVIFIWGVIMYIAQADDEAARKKAKQLMLWGIIGLVVITAVWGIVNVILLYFGVGDVTGGFVPGPEIIPGQN